MPGTSRLQDETRSREHPLVPDEGEKNQHVERTRSEFRDRQETAAMSRRASFSSIRTPSLGGVQADGYPSHKKSSSMGDYLTVKSRRHETNPPKLLPTEIPTIFITPVDSETP
ncbi:hypothetical protein DL93DRAFT_2092064 [Clavulina sp. PMI_390]|nr:hypothetical protein DL93DRAFT_2092064 [Clavulina sp. PMI_390]